MDTPSTAARRERIAALVAEEGFLRVATASERFGVSEVTARADLRALEAMGLVRRVHGGALAMGGARESPLESAAQRDAGLKRAIGRRAATLVRSGGTVFLDVGSTTLAVAEALADRIDLSDVVIVTNGLLVALALEPAIPRITVILTGGTLRPLQHSLVDPIAGQTLAGLHVELAILGCSGIDETGRLTNVNLPEAAVKRAAIAASDRRILVADSSKFGIRHLGFVGDLTEVDTLVTAGPDIDRIEPAAAAAGARLLLA